MNGNKTLAIMAAGLGTRFGSLKQLHPIHSKGYAIIDYSIFDAISVGFNRIVFIVRDKILDQFKERYEKKLPENVTVEFVIQDTKNIPKSYKTKRTKPWGTGHALLMLKDVVKDPFVLINADDFYGKESFQLIHDALYDNNSYQNYLVGFLLNKTLSKSGYVSRGECFLDDKKCLSQIIERTKIATQDDGTIVYLDSNDNKIEINPKAPVSMNIWGFSSDIFEFVNKLFKAFLKENSNDDKAEFYLANIVDYTIKNDLMEFKILSTTSQWYGITYKEDHDVISSKILEFTKKGMYPEILWEI